MRVPIPYGLAILLGLAISAIGVRFRVVPRAAAAGYGIRAEESGDAAYLAVKGLRDASYGIAGLVLLVVAEPHVVGWFLLVVTLAPLGDTLIVLRHGGTRTAAFGIHFATAVLMLADTALLFSI